MGLSPDPDARARQLSNLQRQSFPPAPPENQRARIHGGYVERAAGPVAEIMEARFYETLVSDSPLREDPKFAHLVALVSGAFQRLADLKRHIDANGADIGSPKVQGWIELETRLRRECNQGLQQLGMAPDSQEDALAAFVADLRARVAELRSERERPALDEPIIDADVDEVA